MEPPPRTRPPEQPAEGEEHTVPVPLLAGEDEEEAVLDPHIHRGID
ncbi:hypothetical protein ACWC2T_01170 [Streptomyces sp. NPDC001393]